MTKALMYLIIPHAQKLPTYFKTVSSPVTAAIAALASMAML